MNFYIAVIGYLTCVGLLTKLSLVGFYNDNYIYGTPDVTVIGVFGCLLAMGLLTIKYDWGLAAHFLRESLNIKEVKE